MTVSCFHCGREVRVGKEHFGREIACPHCHKIFPVPGAGTSEDEYLEESSRRGEFLVPAVVSFLVHGVLLLLFSLVTWSYQAGGGLGEEVLIGELPSIELQKSGDEELDSAELETAFDEKSEVAEVFEEVAPPSPSADQEALELSAFPVAPAGRLTELPAVQMVAGGGSGAGKFEFLDGKVRGHAKWLCIVADRSGSMEGEKLEYVKQEILETLTKLKPSQRFQLVFYNQKALPYPKSGWLRPDRERDELGDWLRKVDASGQTEPTPAFEVAFKLRPRPDVIVFLTDGLFEDYVVDDVARLNARGERRTKVFTVSFIDNSAEAMLRQIAQKSGAKYRHVSGF